LYFIDIYQVLALYWVCSGPQSTFSYSGFKYCGKYSYYLDLLLVTLLDYIQYDAYITRGEVNTHTGSHYYSPFDVKSFQDHFRPAGSSLFMWFGTRAKNSASFLQAQGCIGSSNCRQGCILNQRKITQCCFWSWLNLSNNQGRSVCVNPVSPANTPKNKKIKSLVLLSRSCGAPHIGTQQNQSHKTHATKWQENTKNRTTLQNEQRRPGEWRQLRTRNKASNAVLVGLGLRGKGGVGVPCPRSMQSDECLFSYLYTV
jgi:hypothetical protein